MFGSKQALNTEQKSTPKGLERLKLCGTKACRFTSSCSKRRRGNWVWMSCGKWFAAFWCSFCEWQDNTSSGTSLSWENTQHAQLILYLPFALGERLWLDTFPLHKILPAAPLENKVVRWAKDSAPLEPCLVELLVPCLVPCLPFCKAPHSHTKPFHRLGIIFFRIAPRTSWLQVGKILKLGNENSTGTRQTSLQFSNSGRHRWARGISPSRHCDTMHCNCRLLLSGEDCCKMWESFSWWAIKSTRALDNTQVIFPFEFQRKKASSSSHVGLPHIQVPGIESSLLQLKEWKMERTCVALCLTVEIFRTR